MLTSNYALQFVSYPMQVISAFSHSTTSISLVKVLGKSVKPVPVMFLGVLIARKRYPLAKYLYVLLIVLGNVERDESVNQCDSSRRGAVHVQRAEGSSRPERIRCNHRHWRMLTRQWKPDTIFARLRIACHVV